MTRSELVGELERLAGAAERSHPDAAVVLLTLAGLYAEGDARPLALLAAGVSADRLAELAERTRRN